jgi:flagellar basal body rod protein FlgG
MDLLSAAASAGLRSRTEALDLLANNLANAQTTGYKADRELYARYQTGEAYDAHTAWQDLGVLPDIDDHWTDFAQGALTVTNNPLDTALEGRGFFVVEAPGGERMLSRDGHFRLAPDGRLLTQDGYAVLGVRTANNQERRAEAVRLDPAQPFEIDREGNLRQGGNAVGQLLLTDPENPQALPRRSGNYFSLDPRYLERPARSAVVHQGRLEAANFSPAETSVRLVSVLRQFEGLQRALQMSGEMGRRAEEIARV